MDEGWKRAPEMVADLHATSMPSDPKWITRFTAELRLIPGMTGLDAVRIAKQEFERRQYLDPVDAARTYVKEVAAGSRGE